MQIRSVWTSPVVTISYRSYWRSGFVSRLLSTPFILRIQLSLPPSSGRTLPWQLRGRALLVRCWSPSASVSVLCFRGSLNWKWCPGVAFMCCTRRTVSKANPCFSLLSASLHEQHEPGSADCPLRTFHKTGRIASTPYCSLVGFHNRNPWGEKVRWDPASSLFASWWETTFFTYWYLTTGQKGFLHLNIKPLLWGSHQKFLWDFSPQAPREPGRGGFHAILTYTALGGLVAVWYSEV